VRGRDAAPATVTAVPEAGTVGNAVTIRALGRGRVAVAEIRVVVADRLVQLTATVQVAAFARVIALVAVPSPPGTVTRPRRGLMGSGPAPVTPPSPSTGNSALRHYPTVIRFPRPKLAAEEYPEACGDFGNFR
jgi:hypothetical protein